MQARRFAYSSETRRRKHFSALTSCTRAPLAPEGTTDLRETAEWIWQANSKHKD